MLLGLAVIVVSRGALGSELWVGAATTSITPDKPVAVDGQFNTRVATNVEAPITATAVAIESRDGERVLDQAIMVSCDLVAIRHGIQDSLRKSLENRLPGFDLRKLFLTATHTHTAPVTEEGKYEIPKDGVMQPNEYVDFLLERLGAVIVQAWERRQPGGVSWGLGHAVVGHNRRAVYADGTAQMYGQTGRPEFQSLESGEDHTIEMLFFWDREKKPLAVAVNVVCPSQEVEGRSTVNADFWHDVREQLHARVSPDLCVLGWPGAAGDQSPHLMFRKEAELRMQKLRGVSTTQEIARRIVAEVADVLELTRQDIRSDVPLVHKVESLDLPRRKVTEQEAAKAQAEIDAIDKNLGAGQQTRRGWFQKTLDRHREQDQAGPYTMELHALRIGDTAMVTNPFELFLDYGIRIKARSKALQTFVLQLTCDSGYYLATQEAVRGGGYSAVVESNLVSPEGGQILVDRSVELINSLWQ
jgi:hypothetical protein